MISEDHITQLAELARLTLSDEERESLRGDIVAILDFVGALENVSVDLNNEMKELPEHRNIMRADGTPHEPRRYSDSILRNAPRREGDFIRVKKIL